MPRDLVDQALRRWTNPQNRVASAGDLRPPRISNDLRHDPKTDRLRLQHFELFLGLHLQRDLRLSLALPPSQYRGFRVVLQEVLVARERRVRALRCNFSCSLSATPRSVPVGTRGSVRTFRHA